MSDIIIVGNGPSILLEEMGKEIDTFDKVIRMKRCEHQLKQPEYFGTKTDVLAGSLSIATHLKRIHAEEYWVLLDSRHDNPEAMRYLKEDVSWQFRGKDMKVFPELAEKWREIYLSARDGNSIPVMDPHMEPSRYGDERGERHPSQGFQTLVYAAALYPGSRIMLVGFDNLMTGEFTWSITRGPQYRSYPMHRWDIEHGLLPLIQEEYDVEVGFMLPDIPEEES